MGSRSNAHRRRVSISTIALATALFFIPGVPIAAGADPFPEPDYVNCPEESLQAAIDAASPGDDLYLSGTCVENVVIDKDLYLDGFSGRLDGGGSGPVVHVLPGVSVGMGFMSIDNGVAEYGGAIYNEGNLGLDIFSAGGNRASIAGGAIYNEGDLALWDTYITDNTVDDGGSAGGGGAIYNLGTASIGFTQFIDNTAPRDRGGAIFNLGEVVLWDVAFEGNRAKFGGAIASGREGHDGPVSMTLDEVYMSASEAHLGGAIRLEAGGHMTATDLYVRGSQAVEGGGISADGATIELSDSAITGNSVAIGGGGIALRNGASLTAENLVVDGNTAAANGGGILVKGSTVELVDSRVTNNTGNSGGGISNAEGSNTTLFRTAVAFNVANHYGGGVFNTGSDVWITQSTVSNNTATVLGGGLANRWGGSRNGRLFVTNSTLGRNAAPRGSAIDNVDAFVTMDHATITENTGGAPFYEMKSPPETPLINSIFTGNPGQDCSTGHCFDPQLTPVIGPAGYVDHYEPLAGSPVLNQVPVWECTQTVDQVGAPRPMGSGCDWGSIEVPETITEMFIDADFAFGQVFAEQDLTFSGLAQDDNAVKKVLVGIKDRDRGLWLADNKTTWGSFNQMPAELSPPDAASTAWALEVDLDNGNYSLAARAFDYDGNWVDIVPYRHFVVASDVTAPQVDADFAPRTEFFSAVLLTGTATDATGVEAVRVAIRDRVTKDWLQADRVSWGPNFSWFYANGDGWSTPEVSWYFEVELPIGQYNLAALAVDAAGNWGEMSPYRAFNVIAE